MALFGNKNVVFNSYPADIPILVQNIKIKIRSVYGVSKVRFDDESAEVNLALSIAFTGDREHATYTRLNSDDGTCR